MNALSARQLLNVWEQGQGQTSTERALTLVAALDPGSSPQSLAKLSIGQRDACLLSLREDLFGPTVPCMVICPACGERLELTLQTKDIHVDNGHVAEKELTFERSGYKVYFRLPDSTDLQAIGGSKDKETGQKTLLSRCILDARRNGKRARLDRLPKKVIEALAARMAKVDPQADVQLALTCPACEHKWLATFDILVFLWREIEAWARRILMEVHILAGMYGWSEVEILNLSPGRRQIYLDMALGRQ